MNKTRRVLVAATIFSAVMCMTPCDALARQSAVTTSDDEMLALMLRRVESAPDHSESWRMLGKIYTRRGQHEQAVDALGRALDAMPDNVAAHFDLGHLMNQLDREAESDRHFQKVCELAPQSEYASRVMAKGFQPNQVWESVVENRSPAKRAVIIGTEEYSRLDPSLGSDDPTVIPASYEIQSFDGSLERNRRLANLLYDSTYGTPSWRILAETGVLYNSNVTLTPISRQLTDADAASAQWFANPEMEWTVWRNDTVRTGPMTRAYFTINESNLDEFNLASYQAGAFIERDFAAENDQWIARLDYLFSIDQFSGESLGDRHSATASLMKINSNANITYYYANISTTQFVDDGFQPDTTSLDGNSYAVGVSRFFVTSYDRLPKWSLGMDWESVITEGDDFRYHSLRAHADATLAITDRIGFIASTAAGFRQFPDFTGSVDRDEFTWRTAGDLRFQINPFVSVSIVANYDRFASDNENFDVDRFMSGIITRLSY